MGVIPTIAPFLLPRLLPALRRAYPRLRLFLKEELTARLVEDLRAGALDVLLIALPYDCGDVRTAILFDDRSEEHTSELQSLMRISYAVFCLKKKNKTRKSR